MLDFSHLYAILLNKETQPTWYVCKIVEYNNETQLYTVSPFGIGNVIKNVLEEDLQDISNPLPKEYQQVEYIESTGTQIINTNVYPDSQKAYDAQMLFSISSLSYYGNVFSSQGSGSNLYLTRLVGDTNVLQWYTPAPTGQTFSRNIINPVVLDKKYKMDIHYESGDNKAYIDDTLTANNTNDIVSLPTQPFCLFAAKPSNPSYCSNMKLFSFTLKIDNIKTLELVPCYRKSDYEVGLYDIVNDQFYTNVGAGKFIRGNNV